MDGRTWGARTGLQMSATGSWWRRRAAATYILVTRSVPVTMTIETLQERMQLAAAALDFEEARRYRDMINMMRGGATATEAEEANFTGLKRQEPGAMGLGTSQQKMTPPDNWRAPPKPDLMTAARSTRRRRPGS